MFIDVQTPRPAPPPLSTRVTKRPPPLSRRRAVNLDCDPERFLLPSIVYASLEAARRRGDKKEGEWWAFRSEWLELGGVMHLTDAEALALGDGYAALAAISRGAVSKLMRQRGLRWSKLAGRRPPPRVRRAGA